MCFCLFVYSVNMFYYVIFFILIQPSVLLPTWSQCIILYIPGFGLLFFCWEFSHLYSSGTLACNFLWHVWFNRMLKKCFLLLEFVKDWCNSYLNIWQNSLVKPFGHGLFLVGCFLITNAIIFGSFPGGVVVKNPSTNQCRRPKRLGFDPCVRKIHWRRKWQSTPVFLPGESHGQRDLAEYSLCCHKESDMT